MKKILAILLAASALLSGCEVHEDTFFDIPFAYLVDSNGQSSMIVDNSLDNLLTELYLKIDLSGNQFSEPVTVTYETTVGNGLQEGVDFKIQASTKSPLTFSRGTYSLPIRIIWLTRDLDPSKDNTLTFTITGTSLPEMLIGLPGPDSLNKSYIFTKKTIL